MSGLSQGDRNFRKKGVNAAAIPRSEWSVGILGLLLVGGSVAYLTITGLTSEHAPPDVTVSVVRVLPLSSGHLVEIEATNQGGTTAADVTVEGKLARGEEEVETSEITFDFVPAHSERTAGLVFTQNPRDFDIVLRTVSHREP